MEIQRNTGDAREAAPADDAPDRPSSAGSPDDRSWTFLTNHAHVLITISRNPELRQREISDLVGITEGAVQRILHELEVDGYVARERVGRRNRYALIADRPLRHRLEAGHTIEELIDTVNRHDGTAE